MRIVIKQGPDSSQLVGEGWGVNGSDVVFHKGSTDSCYAEANKRNLPRPEVHAELAYSHTEFSKTTFDVGDKVVFIRVEMDNDGYCINSPRIITMTDRVMGDRVHHGSFYAPRNKPETVGVYQCQSICGFSRAGQLHCANNENDIKMATHNAKVWLHETYKQQASDLATYLGNAKRLRNELARKLDIK